MTGKGRFHRNLQVFRASCTRVRRTQCPPHKPPPAAPHTPLHLHRVRSTRTTASHRHIVARRGLQHARTELKRPLLGRCWHWVSRTSHERPSRPAQTPKRPMSAKCPPQNWADIEESRWRRQNVRPLSAVLSGVLSGRKVTIGDMGLATKLGTRRYADLIFSTGAGTLAPRWRRPVLTVFDPAPNARQVGPVRTRRRAQAGHFVGASALQRESDQRPSGRPCVD